MPYAFVQDVPIDESLYRRIRERMGPEPLAGALCHLVVRRADGRLRYIDVWESERACTAAFEERIHPAVRSVLAEAGIRPDGEPAEETLDVVALEIRGHDAMATRPPTSG